MIDLKNHYEFRQKHTVTRTDHDLAIEFLETYILPLFKDAITENLTQKSFTLIVRNEQLEFDVNNYRFYFTDRSLDTNIRISPKYTKQILTESAEIFKRTQANADFNIPTAAFLYLADDFDLPKFEIQYTISFE